MAIPLVLIQLFGTAAVVVAAGTLLARSADVIAVRTGLGGLWVGSILLAVATSLPELTTDITAVRLGVPDLAAGDLFGSSMANMLILALVGLAPGADIFRRAALDNVLGAALAIVLTCIAAAIILVGTTASYFGVGPGSIVILLVYVGGTRAIFLHSRVAREAGERVETLGVPDPAEADTVESTVPTLRASLLRFAAGAVAILVAAPLFARSATSIAEITGISASFIGAWLVALATSLPELVTSLAAVRLRAYDLAVGNLFGSNAVNMVMFLPLDFVHTAGPILGQVGPEHVVAALAAVALMALGLAAIVFRAMGRLTMREPNSLVIILAYLAGLGLVYLAAG